jgi:hypothetical protein
VYLRVPVIKALSPLNFLDEGRIKRVRGIAYTTKISPQIANRLVDGARGILNSLLPDVYIYTDHFKGKDSGLSVGCSSRTADAASRAHSAMRARTAVRLTHLIDDAAVRCMLTHSFALVLLTASAPLPLAAQFPRLRSHARVREYDRRTP